MKIKTHKDLEVYQLAFRTSIEIFQISKSFPKEEIFSLKSQIRDSSRSVSANIAEAQVWLDYSLECGYISRAQNLKLYNDYDNIIGKLVKMINSPQKWTI
jgi:hypothetical protein